MKDLLHELRQDFWYCAFREARRCDLTVDGVYEPVSDLEFMLMYCAGGPL